MTMVITESNAPVAAFAKYADVRDRGATENDGKHEKSELMSTGGEEPFCRLAGLAADGSSEPLRAVSSSLPYHLAKYSQLCMRLATSSFIPCFFLAVVSEMMLSSKVMRTSPSSGRSAPPPALRCQQGATDARDRSLQRVLVSVDVAHGGRVVGRGLRGCLHVSTLSKSK